MDKHTADDQNNPINFTDENETCEQCGGWLENEICDQCDRCIYCGDMLKECSCIDTETETK